MTWNTLSSALRQIEQAYWVRPHLTLSSFIKRDPKETREINFLLRFGSFDFQIVFSYGSNHVTYWHHFFRLRVLFFKAFAYAISAVIKCLIVHVNSLNHVQKRVQDFLKFINEKNRRFSKVIK